MRIAITQGTLRIPPTYFTVQHAQMLADRHDFAVFTLAADVRDAAVTVPVTDFVPARSQPFRRREIAIPAFLPAMAATVVRWQPNLIHQHFATWSIPAIRAARRAAVPLVVTLHGADVFAALRAPAGAMHRWHLHNIHQAREHATRVLAVSNYLADRAAAAGFAPSRTEVHYQGIDTDYFTPGTGTQDGAEPVVAFVGALAEHKGVRDLIDASLHLRRTLPHRLVLVGDGPLRGVAEEVSREHPHVVVRGPLLRDDVRAVLRGAHCLVLPTREHHGWREAAGLVLLEAQACGTPVVTYRSGGASEMLDEGRTGLVAPDGDVAGLTSALGEVLALSGEDLATMRGDAREFVVRERSLRASADALDSHYRMLA